MKFVVFTYTQGWGGTEQHTVHLTGALSDRGHDVTLVELGHGQYSGRPGVLDGRVSLASIDIGAPTTVSFARWMSLLWAFRGDRAVLAKGGFGVGSLGFDLAARFSFGRYAVIEHLTPDPLPVRQSQRHLGGLVPGLGLWWELARLRHLARSMGPQMTICVSHAIATRLTSDFGYVSSKVLVVQNGVDSDLFKPDPLQRCRQRAAWGIPPDAVVIGTVGRLDPIKGCSTLLRCFADLVRECPALPIRLVFIGEGSEEASLRALSRANGIERLVLFPGQTARPWDVYPAFDLFALASRNEGLPLSLLEAMSCGCLPVTTAVGGIPEVLSDAGLGWLVSLDDEDQLRKALRLAVAQVLADDGSFSQRVREHIRTRFSLRQQMAGLVRLLEQS